MTKYRKKPVVIEARQLVHDPGNDMVSRVSAASVSGWMIAHGCQDFHVTGSGKEGFGLDIPTLEGVMHASPGDYIIRGVQGEFYPCKPDIFLETYEAVE